MPSPLMHLAITLHPSASNISLLTDPEWNFSILRLSDAESRVDLFIHSLAVWDEIDAKVRAGLTIQPPSASSPAERFFR